MDSRSSETGDNMPTHETDAVATTSGSKEDAAKQLLVHGDSAK